MKTLATINNGLTNLNNIVTNLVNRLEVNGGQTGTAGSNPIAQRSSQLGLDASHSGPSKIQLNLAQIRQQFSSAIAAAQKQQQIQSSLNQKLN